MTRTFDPSTIQVRPNGPLQPQTISRLNAIKDASGISYAKLGVKLGLSGTFVYNLMNKSMNVNTQHIRRIAEAIEQLENPSVDGEKISDANDANMLPHTYHLRPNLQLSMELPSDLTEKEAERLSLFIRSLPTA